MREALTERQAEAGAFGGCNQVACHLAERLEGNDDVFRAHADAGVGNFERDTAILLKPRSCGDTFKSVIIPQHSRRLNGFDETINSPYLNILPALEVPSHLNTVDSAKAETTRIVPA